MADFPKNSNDEKLIQEIKTVLKKKGKQSTPSLAEKIGNRKNGISDTTAKSRLHTHREYFEENEGIDVSKETDGTPGEPTNYWRLEE